MFETKSSADDLTLVDRESEPDLLVIDSAASPSPSNDGAQRQRIVARHLAALADHLQRLSELGKVRDR